MDDQSLLSEETISNKIYFIRGQKVMLDRDLALLYGVKTRILTKQLKGTYLDFQKILCLNSIDQNLKIGNHKL
jgi:ribosomal protein L4